MADPITKRKSNKESMAHYQDRSKCPKTPNSLIRRDAKGDSDKLTEEDFRKCIESMPKRCKLVILARGGSIKY